VIVQSSYAVASNATRVCGKIRLGVANNSKKITPCWNQDVKGAIHANNVTFTLPNKTKSLHLWCADD